MRGRNEDTIRIARRLRVNQTDAEALLWKHIRNRQIDGHKFVRQQPIAGYICDFVCREKLLVIEVDGGQHAAGGTGEHLNRVLDRDRLEPQLPHRRILAQPVIALVRRNEPGIRSHIIVLQLQLRVPGMPTHLQPLAAHADVADHHHRRAQSVRLEKSPAEQIAAQCNDQREHQAQWNEQQVRRAQAIPESIGD